MKVFLRKWVASVLVVVGAVLCSSSSFALTLNEAQKLLASDGAASKLFGTSVAVDGDTAIIGATGDRSNGFVRGAAYIFIRDSNGTWNQQAKLLADAGGDYDFFGYSVALSGNTAVIGALGHSDNGYQSGAAYIFTRDSSGTWSQQAKLLASDGTANDNFGGAVALFGDTAVIGALNADINSAVNAGAAYVFTRNSGSVWSQQAKLAASDGAASDLFAQAVTISGDTALIGNNSGSAYAFARNTSGTWSQQAKLQANDGDGGNNFGYALAVDGNTAVIGAYQDNVSRGAAYIFSRDSSDNWSQQAKLVPSTAASGVLLFGFSVALSGNTAVVGSFADNDNGYFSGSVYAFTRDSSGNWNELVKLLASDGAAEDFFGQSVAVSGNTALIGATGADPIGSTNAGAVYVYTLDITPEQQLSNLKAQVQTLIIDNPKLNGLSGLLTGVNFGNPIAATQQLETFIRRVERDVQDGRLDGPEGDELIDAANQLIQTIQSS